MNPRARSASAGFTTQIWGRDASMGSSPEARGVRVEDAGANAPFGEMVGEELRLGQVGGGVDALQKR